MKRLLFVFSLCLGLGMLSQTGCGGSGVSNVGDNPDADAAAAYEAAIKADQEAMNENAK